MEFLLIDDNKDFASVLCKKLNGANNCADGKVLQPGNGEKLNAMAERIITATGEDTDIVLFININLVTAPNSRLLQNGIELLKWLRLQGFNNHCVMYSFLSLHKLVKTNPLNAVLLSKGVSYVQMPDAFSGLSTDEKAEKSNLMPFFMAEVDLVKIRHEMANKWAIQRMEWLLEIEGCKSENQYSLELLKFLTPSIKNSEIDRNVLKTLITDFMPNGKKIFFYDDMADEWSEILKNLFGKANVQCYTPKHVPPENLFGLISNFKPGCLLLDLRLENEKEFKDVLDYSGGELLIELKKRFFTLPVIMFTATNKAESLRQLLAAGAEYVWTKEGVDNGINNENTLNNAINLIKEVSKSLKKFKNTTYEQIYKAECGLNPSVELDEKILNSFNDNNKLKFVKSIYFDTNYLIDSIKNNYFGIFHDLLKANDSLPESGRDVKRKMKICIHSDVFHEIYNISIRDENYSGQLNNPTNNGYIVPVCRFLIEYLFKCKQAKLIYVETTESQEKKIEEFASFKINKFTDLNSVEIIENEKKSFFSRLAELFEDRQTEQNVKINNKIEEINKWIELQKANISELPDFSKLKLHADDTFQFVIPNALRFGGVIFVSDDKNCAYNVGYQFDNHNYEVINRVDYSSAGNSRINGVVSAKLKVNDTRFSLYKHYYNNEFNNLVFD